MRFLVRLNQCLKGFDVTITKADVERKRNEVRKNYSTHGFHSDEYQNSFNELHDLGLAYMAQEYRNERGLPPNAKTPYCPDVIKTSVGQGRLPINTRIYFGSVADAGDEIAAAWRAAGEAENILAEKLKDMPDGIAVKHGSFVWYLGELDGYRVLNCAVTDSDGVFEEVNNRHQIGLEWGDYSENDLRDYESQVILATEAFEFFDATKMISDYQASVEGCAAKLHP